MTPSEIHDLYAPLWKLVPETRPKNLDDDFGLRHVEGNYCQSVEASDTLAVCRSAALEWLTRVDGEANECQPLFKRYSNEAGAFVFINWSGESFWGASPDHALVAAALKTAEQQKATT